MTLTRICPGTGKTDAKRYGVQVRFVELFPDQTIVEAVAFVSQDPAFAVLTCRMRTLPSVLP